MLQYFPLSIIQLLFNLSLIAVPLVFSTNFADNYTPIKWISFYLLSALCLGTFLFFKKIHIPSIDKSVAAILAGLVFFYVISILINFNSSYQSQYLDWICFLVFFLISYQLLVEKVILIENIYRTTVLATVMVMIVGWLQVFGVHFSDVMAPNHFPASTFGQQNMTAEFIGFSTLIQLYFLLSRSTLKKIFFLSLTCAFLYFLSCRASFLALFISIFPLSFVTTKKDFLSCFLKISTTTIVFVFLIQQVHTLVLKEMANGSKILPLKTVTDRELSVVKSTNSAIRITRWINTVYLIKDHLLGIGPGNYEFGYLPYHNRYKQDPESNEFMVVKSPHNGIIEAAAENGIFSAMILIVLVVMFFLKTIIRLKKDPKIKAIRIVHAVLLFFLVDSMFSFPLENTFPFMIISIFLALGAYYHYPPLLLKKVFVIKSVKAITLVVLILIVFIGYKYVYSKWVERNFSTDYQKVAKACEFFPENWRLCLTKADLEYNHGEIEKSIKTLKEALLKREHLYPAFTSIGFAYLSLGKIDLACTYLKKYEFIFRDSLYRQQVQIHKDILRICGS